MVDIRMLASCKCHTRIGTSIGELSICGISRKDSRHLDDLLCKRADPCTPEQFIRQLMLLICCPPDALKDGNYKPDSPCLSEDEITRLSLDNLEQIASIIIENEQYLSRKLTSKKSSDSKGEPVWTSEYGEIEHPREKDESNIAYFHRLWALYHERRKRERKEMVASLTPDSHFSLHLMDGIGATLRREEAVRQSMQDALQEAINQAGGVAAMREERRLLDNVDHASLYVDSITKAHINLKKLHESVIAPYRAIQDTMASQAGVLERLSARVSMLDSTTFGNSQFAEATAVWNVASFGLASRMNDTGLSAQREALSVRLLEVPNVYTRFLEHTTDRFTGNLASDIAPQLRASLNLAQEQMLGISGTVCDFIDLPDDEEDPSPIRVLNAPFAQQDELIASRVVNDEHDTEGMAIISPTAQIVERTRRVLKLIVLCNEAAKTSRSCVEIFKPTTRVMEALIDLPWIVATDRSHFAEVVDCLYFIFYEGAGKDNLRFLDAQGGPLDPGECEVVWCIKQLRNKWSRHDADHGEQKQVRKSWRELAGKFQWLGLAEYPTTSQHFQHMHHQLLVFAECFLNLILSRLKLGNSG